MNENKQKEAEVGQFLLKNLQYLHMQRGGALLKFNQDIDAAVAVVVVVRPRTLSTLIGIAKGEMKGTYLVKIEYSLISSACLSKQIKLGHSPSLSFSFFLARSSKL